MSSCARRKFTKLLLWQESLAGSWTEKAQIGVLLLASFLFHPPSHPIASHFRSWPSLFFTLSLRSDYPVSESIHCPITMRTPFLVIALLALSAGTLAVPSGTPSPAGSPSGSPAASPRPHQSPVRVGTSILPPGALRRLGDGSTRVDYQIPGTRVSSPPILPLHLTHGQRMANAAWEESERRERRKQKGSWLGKLFACGKPKKGHRCRSP